MGCLGPDDRKKLVLGERGRGLRERSTRDERTGDVHQDLQILVTVAPDELVGRRDLTARFDRQETGDRRATDPDRNDVNVRRVATQHPVSRLVAREAFVVRFTPDERPVRQPRPHRAATKVERDGAFVLLDPRPEIPGGHVAGPVDALARRALDAEESLVRAVWPEMDHASKDPARAHVGAARQLGVDPVEDRLEQRSSRILERWRPHQTGEERGQDLDPRHAGRRPGSSAMVQGLRLSIAPSRRRGESPARSRPGVSGGGERPTKRDPTVSPCIERGEGRGRRGQPPSRPRGERADEGYRDGALERRRRRPRALQTVCLKGRPTGRAEPARPRRFTLVLRGLNPAVASSEQRR